jgi:branched-chain amino acid transport system substrate-binding protein
MERCLMEFMGKSAIAKTWAIVVAVLIIGAAIGYGISIVALQPSAPTKPTEIKIGFVYGLTGDDARMGEVARRVFEGMAIKEINAAGGVKSLGGLKFLAVWADHQGKPEVAMAEAERLITESHVNVIVGSRTSSTALPVAQVCERYKIPFICSDASSPQLTNGTFTWLFRPVANDYQFGKPNFPFLKDLKAKTGANLRTMAYVYENSMWGQGVAEAWKSYNADPQVGGYTVVADITYARKTADVTSEVLKVKDANPDVILMASYQADALLFLKTFKQLDFYPKLFICQDGFNKPEFLEGIKGTNLGDYLFMSTKFNLDMKKPKAIEIGTEYQQLYKEVPTSDVAGWYTSFWTLYKALEKAGSLEPGKIRDALRAIEIPEEEIPTVGGVKFDANGQNINVGILILQYLNSTWNTVYPSQAAATDYVYPIPTWSQRP